MFVSPISLCLLVLHPLAVGGGVGSATRPAGALQKAMLKKRGASSVAVEVAMDGDGSDTAAAVGGSTDLSLLSMQLRKGRAASLFSSSLSTVAALCDEQSHARGDFPGPCPVVFSGPVAKLAAAVEAGASGVVLGASEAEEAASLDATVEVLWRVSSKADIDAVISAGYGTTERNAFLIAEEHVKALLDELPSEAWAIAEIDSMQADGAEIEFGRALVAEGRCTSLLLRHACVGDDEDVPYTQYAIDGIQRKASSTFKIDGFTGAVNGHFGSRDRRYDDTSESMWQRKTQKVAS